jgi:subtilisin family serine protease
VAIRLRADPRVARVEVEHRARLRLQPNDPALATVEPAVGTAPDTLVEWWAGRSGFPLAWDYTTGAGAVVAVIDTGTEAAHPDLADRILAAKSFDASGTAATTDTVGHGTHVASLACGAGNNGIGLAGAGLRCRLLVAKADLSDSSVAAAIVWGVDNGAGAINMSFGTEPNVDPSQAVRSAVTYAYDHGVVMAAAAADRPIGEQGYPADLLQPSGTGPDLAQGKGFSVTAADALDRRASFAGRGTEISLAAYGAYNPDGGGPPGIFGAFTQAINQLDTGTLVPPQRPCACRVSFLGDTRYAYIQGTSMATPMAAATAALVHELNPDLDAARVIRLLKETARRPAGTGWNAELGWGILDAGAALTRAATLDARAPTSRVTRLRPRTHQSRVTVKWTGADDAPPRVRSSGVARYELWRSTDGRRFRRVYSGQSTTKRLTLRRGGRYAFYSVAVDHAGNREPAPARPDTRITRAR